jgi:small subunit ribosomal protein S13
VKVHLSLSKSPRTSNLLQRSLETFYGIGPNVSQRVMARFHIHPWAKVGALKNSTVLELTAELTTMKIENELRKEVQENIRRLKDMGTYRGRRHAMGLPVRGQKTRTQVRSLVRMDGYRMLTVPDLNGEKFEQDRTWWNWTGANVKRRRRDICNIYTRHAWLASIEQSLRTHNDIGNCSLHTQRSQFGRGVFFS